MKSANSASKIKPRMRRQYNGRSGSAAAIGAPAQSAGFLFHNDRTRRSAQLRGNPDPNPLANITGEQLEQRRLALEFERLQLERPKTSIEMRLKRRELGVAGRKGWVDLLGNPLSLAIVGGFITLMTTTIASHVSTSNSIMAEAAKARQALQADLIKKFVENTTPQTVRTNLKFLVSVGLVPD
jgi:hypothetical protein